MLSPLLHRIVIVCSLSVGLSACGGGGLDGDANDDANTNDQTPSNSDNGKLEVWSTERRAFSPHFISAAADNALTVATADFDNDGDIDIVAGNRRLSWFENSGGQRPVFYQHSIAPIALGFQRVTASDLDGDGDADILVATQSTANVTGALSWLENTGEGVQFRQHSIAANFDARKIPEVADLDGDGDLDILINRYAPTSNPRASLTWFENDGQKLPLFHENTIKTQVVFGGQMRSADYDADGDLDILSAGPNSGSLSWYENDGSDNPELAVGQLVLDESTRPYDFYPADIDQDGDLDIFLKEYVVFEGYDHTRLSWLEYSPGSNPPYKRHHIDYVPVDSGTLVNGFEVTDMDSDGDIDLVIGGEGYLNRYENDGSSRPNFYKDTLQSYALYTLLGHTADINGDGILDLIEVSRSDGTLVWHSIAARTLSVIAGEPAYYNEGLNTSGGKAIQYSIEHAFGAENIANIDDSGELRLFYAEENDASQASSSFWVTASNGNASRRRLIEINILAADDDVDNDGTPNLLDAFPLDPAESKDTDLDLVGNHADDDDDNDGVNDIVDEAPTVAANTQGPIWDAPQQNQALTEFLFLNETVKAIQLADVDADGSIDAVISPYFDSFSMANIEWYQFGEAIIKNMLTGAADNSNGLVPADINGDGYLDWLSYSNGITLYINEGPAVGSFNVSEIIDSFNVSEMVDAKQVADVRVRDIDNDGDLDVIAHYRLFDATWNNNRTYKDQLAVLYNNGTNPLSFSERIVADTIPRISGLDVADMNDDGYMDIVTTSLHTNEKSILTIYKNSSEDGRQQFKQYSEIIDISGANTLALGDIDDDGDSDIIVGASWVERIDGEYYQRGRVYWIENNLNATPRYVTKPISPEIQGALNLSIVDFDNDSDLDIIVGSDSFYQENEISWLENGGAAIPNFRHSLLGTDSNRPDYFDVMDFNNDGILEVASGDLVNGRIVFHHRLVERFQAIAGDATAINLAAVDNDNQVITYKLQPVKEMPKGVALDPQTGVLTVNDDAAFAADSFGTEDELHPFWLSASDGSSTFRRLVELMLVRNSPE